MARPWTLLLLAAGLWAQEPANPPATPPSTPPTEDGTAALARRLADPAGGDAAMTELLAKGAEAVPLLDRAIGDGRFVGEPEGLHRALSLLEHLGPAAGPALAGLVDALGLHQGAERTMVLEAVGRIGPFCPELREELANRLGSECDKHGYMGNDGFWGALSRLKFDATGDLDALLAGLSHDNPFVRELAGEALARRLQQGVPQKRRGEVTARLVEAATGDHPGKFTLEWRWNGGPASTSGSTDRTEQIRAAAARALAVLAPDRPETVPGHLLRLRSADLRERAEAARQLGTLGAAAAVGPLAGLLSGDPMVAREAATALGLIGPPAQQALERLQQAAGSSDRQLAARAQAAVRQLQGPPATAGDDALQGAGIDDAELRRLVGRILAPGADDAVLAAAFLALEQRIGEVPDGRFQVATAFRRLLERKQLGTQNARARITAWLQRK